jgi:endonuclease-3
VAGGVSGSDVAPAGPGRRPARRVMELLDAAYGRPRLTPRFPPLDELIYTVLSQNTADVNTDRSFAALRERFPRWEQVRDAPVGEITAVIAGGGLGATKAPRIKAILAALSERTGRPDLSVLDELDYERAQAYLCDLPGVGPKTAACVLLFSLGRPVMPVDTHVHRVARRLGLIDRRATAEQAHPVLTRLAGPDPGDIYALHVDLVRHGRRCCHARRPACERCPLAAVCPSAGFPERW